MFRAIRKLFARPDPLVKASRSRTGEAFARAIGDADVFVFAAISGEGLDPATFTETELLAEIERTALEMSQSQGFDLFTYTRDELSCLPFFSSEQHAQTFVGEYSKQRNRVYGFQMLGVKGSVVAAQVSRFDRVVLNDWTSDERVLSDEEKQCLHEASA